MISFVNTKTKTVAIPQEADIWYRNKIHTLMKRRFGVYDMVRLNPDKTSDYDIAIVEFDPDSSSIMVMETAAKVPDWSWQEFMDVIRGSKLVMINKDDIQRVQFVEI